LDLPESSSGSIDGHESLPDYVTEVDVSIDDTPVSTSPPDYSIAAGRPTRPVIYTFSDWDDKTVLLMPPGREEELNPLYRISTSLVVHPFVPLAIRMSIGRGGTAQGAFVGSVEIGTSSREYNKVKVNNRRGTGCGHMVYSSLDGIAVKIWMMEAHYASVIMETETTTISWPF